MAAIFKNVVELAARPADVFAIFEDGESWPRWFTGAGDPVACIVHTGKRAKAAQYKWGGVPTSLIKRWDAERERRDHAIKGLSGA